MKVLLLYLPVFFLCLVCRAQSYRLVYDEGMPELYDEVHIILQQKVNGTFRDIMPKRYTLTTTDGKIDHNTFRFIRQRICQNNGIAHFTLKIDGKQIPLEMQLPVLADIRFNLYTDSIKPILNFYVNVEGTFSSGRVLPLDANHISITSDAGSMNGMEWVAPQQRNFEKVTFTATSRCKPALHISKTVYLKKHQDPRDAAEYRGKTEAELLNRRK